MHHYPVAARLTRCIEAIKITGVVLGHKGRWLTVPGQVSLIEKLIKVCAPEDRGHRVTVLYRKNGFIVTYIDIRR